MYSLTGLLFFDLFACDHRRDDAARCLQVQILVGVFAVEFHHAEIFVLRAGLPRL